MYAANFHLLLYVLHFFKDRLAFFFAFLPILYLVNPDFLSVNQLHLYLFLSLRMSFKSLLVI